MSFAACCLSVFLPVLGSVAFARPVQGQYGSQSSSKSDPTALGRAVDAANRRFENAFNSGDAAGAAREFYARDARILPPGSETVQGREKIRAYSAPAATAPQNGARPLPLSTLALPAVRHAC